jgi:hypothetical protein
VQQQQWDQTKQWSTANNQNIKWSHYFWIWTTKMCEDLPILRGVPKECFRLPPCLEFCMELYLRDRTLCLHMFSVRNKHKRIKTGGQSGHYVWLLLPPDHTVNNTDNHRQKIDKKSWQLQK